MGDEMMMKREDDAPSEECVRLLEQANPKDAEIKRLRADNERMRRGMAAVREWNDNDRPQPALGPMVNNLLAGREWNNCADGAKGEGR